MTEKIYFFLCAPIVDETAFGIIFAEAVVTAFFAVSFAVIGDGAHELGIKLTCSVPCTAGRSNRRGMTIKAAGIEVFHEVTVSDSPVREKLVNIVVFSPAGKAVNKNICIFRVEAFLIDIGMGNIKHRKKKHYY